MSVQQPRTPLDLQQKFTNSLENLSHSSYYYFNEKTHEIESTHLGWRIVEWVKGCFNGEDMCDKKLISMYFLKEVAHLPETDLNETTIDQIKTIAKNLELLPRDESTAQNNNTPPITYQKFFNSLSSQANDPTLANAAVDLFYKNNNEKLTKEHPSLANEISTLAQKILPPLAQSPPQDEAATPSSPTPVVPTPATITPTPSSPKVPTAEENIRSAIESLQSEEVETYILGVRNLNAKDEEGNNFLHVAVSNFSPQMMGIIQSLAEAGVDPFQKNNDGNTPLDLCRDSSIVPTYLLETTINTLITPSTGKNRTPEQIEEIKEQANRLYPNDKKSQVKFLEQLGIAPTSPVDVPSLPTDVSPLPDASLFQELDQRFSDLKGLLRVMAPPYPAPLNIPDILLSDEEKKEISEKKVGPQGKLESLEDSLKSLENELLATHKDDLRMVDWHGHASLQRMIWQNESFVKALKNPLMVKLILLRAKENKLTHLKVGNLATFLLYGLTSNNLSYLTSASPNRALCPPTGNWEQLVQLRHAFRIGEESSPHTIDTSYVQNLTKACETLEGVIKQLPVSQDSNIEQQEVTKRAISDLTPSQLMQLFNTLIPDKNKAIALIRGAAVSSTGLESMYGQTLEVMSEFDDLLKKNGNNAGEVLGYALVSHIFDARHLAASLYHRSHPDQVPQTITSNVEAYEASNRMGNTATPEQIGIRLNKGQTSLTSLLDSLEKQELEPNAAQFLSIRLQQVIALIIDNHQTYDVKLEDIRTFAKNP